ncbi:phosphate acyltransferase [Mycoplasmopsis meleagridis]|uniref:phosphate acyltransferase n=1 Tax=Mycoplasmopsis meleagridis TaxID=29561 RepID=UPI00073D4F68|nr:phosphate acyltransferase [Mycoplasmopsis meleagridis]KUH47569.1 hypothetical protein ASB56_00320 [Mycoplasmopsis meleagridis]
MNFTKRIIKQISKIKNKRVLLIDDVKIYEINKAALFLKKIKSIELFFFDKEKNIIDINRNVIFSFSTKNKEYLSNLYVEISNKKAQERNKNFILSTEEIINKINNKITISLLLLESNFVDVVIGGKSFPSAELIKNTLKITNLKTNLLTSTIVLNNKKETLLFSDVSVIPNPSCENLVEIAHKTALFSSKINIIPSLAFLSFSTNLSAKTEENLKINKAFNIFKNKFPNIKAIGEIQFDAAYDLKIRNRKMNIYDNNKINCFIFPNLDAANIGYKIANKLAKYDAFGPFLLGTNKIISDLSRGATTKDIINTILLSVLLFDKKEHYE